MTKAKENKLKYAGPPLLVLALVGIVLAVKGIFPFGSRTIDYYDMAQQIAAFYYHVYDALHGDKSLFFDWYSGLGVNMAMSTSGCSNLSLFNLFFLLVPRELLLESLSVFNLLKMMCMSFTMYLFLHRTFKAPYLFEALFSVGYGFSGFVLVLYITNQWMDLAVLFPLLMLGYAKVLREGKTGSYVAVLSLCLINSYYLTFMMLIFIFLYTGLLILADLLFERRREGGAAAVLKSGRYHLLGLGTGTFLSLGISAFILLPQLLQTLNSSRFSSGTAGGPAARYLELIGQVKGAYTTRWWTLLGLSLAAAVILKGMIRFRRERKSLFLIAGSIALMTAELFFESINLIWHFGSYVQYPIRNGFIISFAVLSGACYYAGKLYGQNEMEKPGQASVYGWKGGTVLPGDISAYGMTSFAGRKKAPVWKGLFTAAAGGAVTALLAGGAVYFYSRHPGLSLRTVFRCSVLLCGAAFGLYLFLLSGRRNTFALRMIPFILAAEFLIYGYVLLGKPTYVTGYSEEPEQEGEYIGICSQLAEKLEIRPSLTMRIKNPDTSLNANYGFVLQRPALSNWTHLIEPSVHRGAAAWGYSRQFTRLLDAGGTVFSDALLGIRQTVSRSPQDPALYREAGRARVVTDRETGEEDVYYLYDNLYTLPLGLTVSAAAPGVDISKMDLAQLQNSMFEELLRPYPELRRKEAFREDRAFVEVVKDGSYCNESLARLSEFPGEDGTVQRLTVKAPGRGVLYLSGAGGDREDRNLRVLVNGEAVKIPTIKDMDNELYPAHFNNNAVCLGTFEEEEAQIELQYTDSETDGDGYETMVTLLDLDKLELLCEAYAGYDAQVVMGDRRCFLTVEAEGDENVLLLPVAYDKGWHVEINGELVDEVAPAAGLFTAIGLRRGTNQIAMSFSPYGMGVGGLISLLSLLLWNLGSMAYGGLQKRLARDDQQAAGSRGDGLVRSLSYLDSRLPGLYMAVWAAAALLMYVIPVAYGLASTVLSVFR